MHKQDFRSRIFYRNWSAPANMTVIQTWISQLVLSLDLTQTLRCRIGNFWSLWLLGKSPPAVSWAGSSCPSSSAPSWSTCQAVACCTPLPRHNSSSTCQVLQSSYLSKWDIVKLRLSSCARWRKTHNSSLILRNHDILVSNSEIHCSPAIYNVQDKTKQKMNKLMISY